MLQLCECQLQQVMVSFNSPVLAHTLSLPPSSSCPPSVLLSLLASSVFCQCCVMPLLSTDRQVLLYSCCIVLLLTAMWMCVGRKARENMFCQGVCVCTCVYQSCSPLLPWQCWAHGSGSFAAQHCQSRAAESLFLTVVKEYIHIHTHKRTRTQTPFFQWFRDWLMDRLSQVHVYLLFTLW